MAERMTTQEAAKLVLKGDIIEVKPIIRTANGFFKEGHDGQFMFTGTKKTYQLPFSMGTRSYVKVFDAKEQEAFEVLLGKQPDSLNLYDRDNIFWVKYSVELTKDGKSLDLSNVAHALEYRVLKANSQRIAPDWASRNRPSYEFALVSGSQVQEDESKRTALYEKAMEKFFELRKYPSKMYTVLRLLDRRLPKEVSTNTDTLKTELLKIIEEKIQSKTSKTAVDFIKAVDDPKFETKALIYDAVDANEITLAGGVFRLQFNDSLMGKNIGQAADYLDDIQNQEERLILQQRMSKLTKK